jgi:hypothetical protein
MVNGKAKLIRDDYCDGLALSARCPTGAITFVEREAAAMTKRGHRQSRQRSSARRETAARTSAARHASRAIERQDRPAAESCDCASAENTAVSRLNQWPVQIKLAPVNAPFPPRQSCSSRRIAPLMRAGIFTIAS